MTEQGLREQLNRVRRMHKSLERDLEKRAHLFAKATGAQAVRTDLDRVQTSLGGKETAILDELADLDLRIEAKDRELRREKKKVLKIIDAADLRDRECEVMRLRYIYCLDWTDIADIMFWSKRQVQRIHGDALLKIGTRWHTMAHDGTRIL